MATSALHARTLKVLDHLGPAKPVSRSSPLPGGHFRIVATVDDAPRNQTSLSFRHCWTNAPPARQG